MEGWLFLAAIGLDLVLGDPRHWPHPVRAIGWAYARLDAVADRFGWRTRRFGLVGVVGVAAVTGGVVALSCAIPWLGPVFWLYWAYAGLAMGDLLAESRKAEYFLNKNDLTAARRVVGGLVSRDVTVLDAAGLQRALAESVSENANDGFMAPLFYLILGGPVLLWVYKGVSTADSMWGYRTARYDRLGWFGARADDVLAYLPARLTAGAMWLVGTCFGWLAPGSWPRVPDFWAKVSRDARTCASPNAGWPMAAAAWLCGAGMGGPATYFGRPVDKPRLGPRDAAWDGQRQRRLRWLVLLSGALVVICVVLLLSELYI